MITKELDVKTLLEIVKKFMREQHLSMEESINLALQQIDDQVERCSARGALLTAMKYPAHTIHTPVLSSTQSSSVRRKVDVTGMMQHEKRIMSRIAESDR